MDNIAEKATIDKINVDKARQWLAKRIQAYHLRTKSNDWSADIAFDYRSLIGHELEFKGHKKELRITASGGNLLVCSCGIDYYPCQKIIDKADLLLGNYKDSDFINSLRTNPYLADSLEENL